MLRHPHLVIAIIFLRPSSAPGIDFIVQDDGEGPYLVDGSMQNPPTQAEVDAVTDEQLDSAQIRMGKPLSVTAAQAKLALYNADLLDAVKEAAAAYPPMQIFFDNAPTWSEDHPYVWGLAAQLGIPDEQITKLFNDAYKL